MGLPKALAGWLGFLPPAFRLIKKDKADNKGVPFCLTEEFAAVYRLHPLIPPGLVIGKNRDDFIPLEKLVGDHGRKTMRENPDRVFDFWDSSLFYPCGHLVPHNYPTALRDLAPTDDEGRGLPDNVDLAALDLYRDRERGILRYNDFRRAIKLKPFKTWKAMTGESGKDTPLADELEAVYGPAPHGIEKCDLLVGDMFEAKLRGFAISETSFIIFLLMASRRLDADPFLNELYNEDTYTKTGLEWIENTSSLKDILKRHYPSLAAKIPEKQSAFKPYGTKEEALSAWDKAANDGVIDAKIQSYWAGVKKQNDTFFQNVATETTPLLSG
jgi:alpha-dioxygenase